MAARVNLIIDQGTTFSTSLVLSGDNDELYDLTNYTASSKIKKHYTSSNSISFTTSINTSISEITLSLTAQQTDAIKPGRYLYDLEIAENANTVIRVIEGTVTVTPSITKQQDQINGNRS